MDEECGYVEIYFEPDVTRFGHNCFGDSNFAAYKAHLMALSFMRDVPIHLTTHANVYATTTDEQGNLLATDEVVEVKSTTDIIDIPDFETYTQQFNISAKESITYNGDVEGEGAWECIIQDTPYQGTVVAFANGAPLREGGEIIDEVYRQVCKKVVDLLGKMAEGIKLNKTHVEKHITIYVNLSVNQPIYSSQQKTYLRNKKPAINFPEDQLRKIKKWEAFREINSVNFKLLQKMQKSDKHEKNTKHVKANLWGNKKRMEELNVFFCEGDSPAEYITKLIGMMFNKSGDGWDYNGYVSLARCPTQHPDI